jgi:eukaryotic-like serine/threonine-protein kinase
MPPPQITADALRALVPALQEVFPQMPPSGQKAVFPCTIEGQRFVLKVLECASSEERAEGVTEPSPLDEVSSRAAREVAILRTCRSPHLPRIGPIGLEEIRHEDKRLVVFSEEFIEGKTVAEIFNETGAFSIVEVLKMATQLAMAIAELWGQNMIHRDIKPENIMRRTSDGTYVLLDPGIALDQQGESLTEPGFSSPHTPGYIAPELIIASKRDADVRADLFLLGVTLYFALTGSHPFITRRGQDRSEIARNITTLAPRAPHDVRADVPLKLSAVVVRLLEKQRHRRFKNCEQLLVALSEVEIAP